MRRDEAYHRQADNDDACSLTFVLNEFITIAYLYILYMRKKYMHIKNFEYYILYILHKFYLIIVDLYKMEIEVDY